MKIQDVVSSLQNEKSKKLTSRFPCRVIMVKTIKQYCQLLLELKKLNDVRVVKVDELISSADVMPKYSNLYVNLGNDWLVLTGVSEYLRLFFKKEAKNRNFIDLWEHNFASSNTGRIIIPLWGCEQQWFDSELNLTVNDRQSDFYFDCVDEEESEQELDLTVLSNLFVKYADFFKENADVVCIGLKEWFAYWEQPLAKNTKFVLISRQAKNVIPLNGKVHIHVINDVIEVIHERMPGSEYLTNKNCSEKMQQMLFDYALQNVPLKEALLKIFNVCIFNAKDIMSKWETLSEEHKEFVRLWYQLYADDSYICYCFTKAKSTMELPKVILHEIFSKRIEKPEWVKEFKMLTSLMKLPLDAEYFKLVDSLSEFEERLDYLSSATSQERIYILKMVGQWLKYDSEQVKTCQKLKEVFPTLVAYLLSDLDALNNAIGTYMLRYKSHKLANILPLDDETYFAGANPFVFDYRYAVISKYEQDDTIVLWIDALGIEWLPLLYWSLMNKSSGMIKQVEVVQATLPTETYFNDQWNRMSVKSEKLNALDKLAHNGVIDESDYYACVDEQMQFVAKGICKRVSELLVEYDRVVITGDHGTSRLAAQFFHKREGVVAPKNAEICSHGRYCKLPANSQISLSDLEIYPKNSQEEQYAIFTSYNHFKQSGNAPCELHGGATPEEMLVPVIVVESRNFKQITATWEKNPTKILMKKARLKIIFSKVVQVLNISINGENAILAAKDSRKVWDVVFSGVKAGTYHIEVVADGKMVKLPDVTFLPAIGGGEFDLP